ncbi:MAG: hypothetical protein QOI13_768 [Paraburkholderia sp.]|jgi:hypothetical protein|nr:hypothetical protein [Paraburkholderia sp.]
MDVLFETQSETSKPEIYESQKVCYGDPFVLESCVSDDPVFLAIVRHASSKRSPTMLRTEVATPGQYPNSDYIWTFVPVSRMGKKRGDVVSFGDRVRIQTFDYTGHYRQLMMNTADRGSITAEKLPSQGASTWFVACAAQLRTEAAGRVVPDGDFHSTLEFGKSNYLALINTARYLSVMPDYYGSVSKNVGTLPDLPASGMATWWRISRSVSDASSRR